MTRIFVSCDSAAVAVGADAVARAIAAQAAARRLDVDLVRTGSRGMAWLEPLVEIETPGGRVGFGPIEPGDVHGLIDVAFPHTRAVPACRIRRPSASSRRIPGWRGRRG